jgi:Domain of unknown function (DUF1707)
VKPEPGARTAAADGGRGRLRASHADREQVIDLLKAAFVQGRLDKDEFDARVGRALASRTYADLAAVTADIPAWPAAATTGICGGRPRVPPPSNPGQARARPSMNNAVTGGACVIVGAHLAMLAAFISGRAVIIVTVAVLTVIAAAVAVVAMVVAS